MKKENGSKQGGKWSGAKGIRSGEIKKCGRIEEREKENMTYFKRAS